MKKKTSVQESEERKRRASVGRNEAKWLPAPRYSHSQALEGLCGAMSKESPYIACTLLCHNRTLLLLL